MSQDKRPIPIPLTRRLQYFRSKKVPLLVFGMTAMVTVMLWRDVISPAMLIGEVATVKSSVNSPVAAAVQRLNAQRLQMVKAGDVIAELRPTDPRQILDLMQSELTLLRLEVNTSDSEQDAGATLRRETMDFERLRLDWMLEKVKLAAAVAKAKRAAMDLELAQGLATAPASSKRYLQDAELAKETADAEETERRALVDTIGRRIEELRVTVTPSPAAKDDRSRKAIASLEERISTIERSQNVITLRAPMDGMVTEVLHRVGENVKEGEALIILTSTQPESIIGYLRQPFSVEPAVGQEVEVRTYGRARLQGLALVTRVGAHFEPILNPALHPAVTPEMGLPVEISLPQNLRLRPGERVSLVIRPSIGKKPAL